MAFQIEPSIMVETLPLLTEGIKLTVVLTLGGLFFGFILGVFTGLGRISRSFVVRGLATAYVETIRGTPMIVQALFLYYGIPMAFGMRMTPMEAGIITIAINSGAYIAEIVRGAIQSIDRGQMEAGRSIGLTRLQTMLHIIWPQAFERMIPPLCNQCIISLKDTSLLTVIGVGELTRMGQEVAAVNFRYFEIYLTIGIVYLMMSFSISKLLRWTEKRLLARRKR